MVTYSFYESDTRLLQYATALTNRGDIVDVIALRRDDRAPEVVVLDGVNVHRIQPRSVNEQGALGYAREILRFLLQSIVRLYRMQRKNPYDLVHVHNVPDFLVYAAAFPKWKRVPVILDIHDLLPELYASKFNISRESLFFKVLALVERCSVAFANHVIVANDLWCDRLVARSSRADKCSVVRNYPDLDIFVPEQRPSRKSHESFVLTYPGSLNYHQGVDVAIRAFARIAGDIPEARFHIYGEGAAKGSLVKLVADLGMQERITFHECLPSVAVARVMAATDLAIEPKRATLGFGNEALSTKILEFMTLGVPIVASRTTIHALYYDDSIIKYYDRDDEVKLAECILEMRRDSQLRARLAQNALAYARQNSWQVRQGEYLQLVDSLSATTSRRPELRPCRSGSFEKSKARAKETTCL
jgi:glycosyltransferase involved in cell wall biosynthesis